jgi:DNA-binding SARP family transcriptional activator
MERDGRGGRLSVLGVSATADLLALIGEARTGASQQAPHSDAIGSTPRPVEAPPGLRPPAPDPLASGPVAGVSPAPTPGLRLQILGTPGLYPAGSSTPVRFARTAALPILVFLALHPEGATTYALTTALWPQLHASATAHRVHTIVSSVRTTLEALDSGPSILRVAERYRLDPQRIDVDLWHLHDAVQAAMTAVDPTDHEHALHRVVEAYTGELADGWAWPWLQPHREATRRHVVDAYVSLTTHHSDPTTVLALLQAAVRTDPANDDLRQRARRAHAATNPTA